MKKWTYAGAIAAISISMPAKAHWQYTKWDMTPVQVIAASKGSAKSAAGDMSAQKDKTRDVDGTYVTGDRTFDVSFWFAEGLLKLVTLSPAGGPGERRCLDLKRDLLAKYGEPIERSPGSVERSMWADKPTGNRVVIISSGDDFCELQYAPLISAAGSGL